MDLVERAWRVVTAALKLHFIHRLGVRTEITAKLLRGRNHALALLVRAFVFALRIRDVVHSLSPFLWFDCRPPRVRQPHCLTARYLGASFKNCFNVVCTPAILTF